MPIVTAEQVRIAMIEAKIVRVPHHDCGACGSVTAYVRRDNALFYDSNCDCTRKDSLPRQVPWGDAAEWINMQSKPETRRELAKRFGLTLEL